MDHTDVDTAIEKWGLRWSKETWIANKERLSSCVWCEGALLLHSDAAMVYFAPEPTEFGVVYEIKRSGIVEILETGRVLAKLGNSYQIVRIYIRPEAVLIKMQWMLATEIPHDVAPLREAAKNLASETSSPPIADRLKAYSQRNGGGGGASPSPSPSPGGGGGGGGSGSGGGSGGGASGVRG
jgi:uncharacterized membrane protein YgcG